MNQIEEKKWFVFLGDHHEGPFSSTEVMSKLDGKQITASSFVWAEGMTDWKLLREIPDFEGLGEKTKLAAGATSKESAAPKIELVGTPPGPSPRAIPSIEIDKTPLASKKIPAPDQVERDWLRRRRIRRAVSMLLFAAMLGGIGFAFNQGHLDGLTETLSERMRPHLLSLSDRFPALNRFVSPIPRLEDVTPEEYAALRGAAASRLDQTGPTVSVALSKNDSTNPEFYISSNLPDGARFDIYIEGVRGTLVGQLSAQTRTSVTVEKFLGKSQPVRLADGKPLPAGEYYVSAIESESQPENIKTILAPLQPLNVTSVAGTAQLPSGLKMLAKRTYFLGGTKDAAYNEKLREFLVKTQEKAKLELAELKQLTATLESQTQATLSKFREIWRANGMTPARKRTWKSFHSSWSKQEDPLNELFQKWTPEMIRQEFFHAGLYESAQQAGLAVQKLHTIQNEAFEKTTESQLLDTQLNEAAEAAQSTIQALKMKLEQIEKTSGDGP